MSVEVDDLKFRLMMTLKQSYKQYKSAPPEIWEEFESFYWSVYPKVCIDISPYIKFVERVD